jgi:hypothetical protein
MLSAILWRCDCGAGMRAVYKQSSADTSIRCPKPGCQTEHTVHGEVLDVHRQTGIDTWEHIPVSEWLVEKDQSQLKAKR